MSDRLPRPTADVLFREMGDETVLVNLGTNRIFSLNATGARFWALLAQESDRDQIERRLLEEFDVDPAALREEIDELLGSLEAEGLIA